MSLEYNYFHTHQFKHVFWVLKRDGSFEYPQHMFWMRNKENSYPIHLSRGLYRNHTCFFMY